jgi:hypothetical protein
LIELNRGLARLDLPDFELASRNDVDVLGAFLEANGMTVVDPPGEYYGRSYYAVYFTDPDGMKLEAMVVQAAEATPGGKKVSRRRFTAHTVELHSPLLITSRKQWNGASDHFLHPQVGASPLALMLRSIAAECECSCSHSRSALRCVSKHEGAHIGSSSSFETRARPFDFAGSLQHARSSG